jgi:hypothetical protein
MWDAEYLNRPRFEQFVADGRSGPCFANWLPLAAREARFMPRMPQNVAAGRRAVQVLAWEPERRVFAVAAGEPVPARVKTYYYPYWQATQGAQLLAVQPDETGALLISLPAEAVTVTLTFQEPLRARATILFSLASWLFIMALWGGSLASRSQPYLRFSPLRLLT